MARVQGLIPAVAAAAALYPLDALERRLSGTVPVYDPRRLARRLFGTGAPGAALRLAYGAALGTLQIRTGAHPVWFGPAIALAEALAFPALGATAPLRRWPRGQLPLLFAHATAFALTVSLLQRAARWTSARATGSAST